MKLQFEIVPVELGDSGALYSIRYKGEKNTELDKFLGCENVQACDEYESLVLRLYDMVESFGFRPGYFKLEEGSYYDSVVALHYENGPLRLYCLRRSSLLLIVGYGGPKFTGTYQEEPVLDEAVKKLQTIDALLDKRQKSREIIINPNTGAMDGDLVFTADDWE